VSYILSLIKTLICYNLKTLHTISYKKRFCIYLIYYTENIMMLFKTAKIHPFIFQKSTYLYS